jgi:hypothetical protein
MIACMVLYGAAREARGGYALLGNAGVCYVRIYAIGQLSRSWPAFHTNQSCSSFRKGV